MVFYLWVNETYLAAANGQAKKIIDIAMAYAIILFNRVLLFFKKLTDKKSRDFGIAKVSAFFSRRNYWQIH